MNKNNNFKYFLFVFLCFTFINITGCATHSVWEKRTSNVATVINEEKANASGFYLKCNNKTVNYQAIISYKVNQSGAVFPPFNKGYMVISSDDRIGHVVQAQTNNENPISFLNAVLWQTTDPDNKKSYWSNYTYGVRNRYGKIRKYSTGSSKPGGSYSNNIDLIFHEKEDSYSLDSQCESLTIKPVNFNVVFKQGSLKYNEYKNPLEFRVVVTPFSIIADMITSPFQLLAFLTVEMWAPR